MQAIHLTPGPTEIHPVAKQAIREALDSDICSISHRSKKFEETLFRAKKHLRSLMRIPEDHRIFFLSSGTENWERIIQNGVEKGSFHFTNGSFSKRFYETSRDLGKQAEMCDKPFGEGFDIDDIPAGISGNLIGLTQNETSTGVFTGSGFIQKLREMHPEKLIAVDAVSCAPYAQIDLRIVDYYFFSVQKFFCLPAGLGVLIAGPRAMDQAKNLRSKGINIGAHHNLLSLEAFDERNQNPCTPNVLGIFAFAAMAEYFDKIVIEVLRAQTLEKAGLLYDCLDGNDWCRPYVKKKSWRSDTVITVDCGGAERTRTTVQALAHQGLIVGEGYGPLKQNQFRVANFSVHRLEDFCKICDVLGSC